MTRMRRIKVTGEDAYYHIVSRTVHQRFLMGDVEKERLVSFIKHYSALYFVKVIGYCIMSNHFHLLVKCEPNHKFTDEEIAERVIKNLKLPKEHKIIDIDYYRKRLENVSEYVRQIKQEFSRWYNRMNNVKGTFWADRFKSVLIEKGDSLDAVLAYIELNPIRAKMVKIPEEYRFSSIAYRSSRKKDRKEFLSYEGLTFEGKRDAFARYRKLVYEFGGIDKPRKGRIEESKIQTESAKDYQPTDKELLNYKIRYFTDGLIIGSKTFLKYAYSIFGGTVIKKKNRHVYKTGVSDKILSVRKLID